MNERSHTVTDVDGREASLASAPSLGSADHVTLRLDSGERLDVASELLEHSDDGTYRLPVAFRTLLEGGEILRMPIVEESLDVSKRVRETGRVRLTKHVETRQEVVDEPLLREEVEIERVPVGRYIDAPVAVRYEGDTTIVPVFEEVLVVEKRLLLKEELHITKRRTERRQQQDVTLRSERVEVERIGPEHPTPEESR